MRLARFHSQCQRTGRADEEARQNQRECFLVAARETTLAAAGTKQIRQANRGRNRRKNGSYRLAAHKADRKVTDTITRTSFGFDATLGCLETEQGLHQITFQTDAISVGGVNLVTHSFVPESSS
jgi:hypothetical protein